MNPTKCSEPKPRTSLGTQNPPLVCTRKKEPSNELGTFNTTLHSEQKTNNCTRNKEPRDGETSSLFTPDLSKQTNKQTINLKNSRLSPLEPDSTFKKILTTAGEFMNSRVRLRFSENYANCARTLGYDVNKKIPFSPRLPLLLRHGMRQYCR